MAEQTCVYNWTERMVMISITSVDGENIRQYNIISKIQLGKTESVVWLSPIFNLAIKGNKAPKYIIYAYTQLRRHNINDTYRNGEQFVSIQELLRKCLEYANSIPIINH